MQHSVILNLKCKYNKTGLQPVSRPVELVHYFGGWVEGPSKQTDRTDGGWVQSTFGAKASRRQTPVKTYRLKRRKEKIVLKKFWRGKKC